MGMGIYISSPGEGFIEEQLGPALDKGHVSHLRDTSTASAAVYAGRSESRLQIRKTRALN
jgi:hypothetical protein